MHGLLIDELPKRAFELRWRRRVARVDVERVQDGAFGASERFAVSPGRETEGYLEIAGGQSGHPLSPYYRAGFDDWAQAKPSPFLPTRPEHELTLTPAK